MSKPKHPDRHDILIAERLAGATIEEAAKKAGYTFDHAKQLFSGKRFPEFRAQYEFLRELHQEELMDQAKRSKDALLSELETIAHICEQGETRYTPRGNEYNVKDLSNWIRSVVERAKILGFYVEKTEHSGSLEVQATPTYNTDNLTDTELAEYEALERKLTAGSPRLK